MKTFLLAVFCCFLIPGLNAQTELSPSFIGKYTISFGVKYDGKIGIMADFNYRAFNSLFTRPLDFNTEITLGTSTFSGNTDIGVALFTSQVYANGNDIKNGFGLGTGLGLGYHYEKINDSPEQDFSLTVGLSPGFYGNNTTIAPSIRYDIIELEKDKDETDIHFGDDVHIGLNSTLILNSLNLSVNLNGYYNMDFGPSDQPENEEDEASRIQLRALIGPTF